MKWYSCRPNINTFIPKTTCYQSGYYNAMPPQPMHMHGLTKTKYPTYIRHSYWWPIPFAHATSNTIQFIELTYCPYKLFSHHRYWQKIWQIRSQHQNTWRQNNTSPYHNHSWVRGAASTNHEYKHYKISKYPKQDKTNETLTYKSCR